MASMQVFDSVYGYTAEEAIGQPNTVACRRRSLVLRWTESGGPPVKRPTRQGFGTHAMERMIRSQLNGEMRFDWHAKGLACGIILRT
jgi:two-component sensor histidine kinase